MNENPKSFSVLTGFLHVDCKMSPLPWVIALAAVGGVVQSLLWMGLGLVGALVYLCVIPVDPYKGESDFLRVSLVKLYFEGPNCKLDGSYLGGFEEKYRDPIITLTHDRVFALMTVYVVINAVYFFLSITMFKGNRKGRVTQGLALSWGVTTLLLCFIDAFCALASIGDSFSLAAAIEDYNGLKIVNLQELVKIPMFMAVVWSRFIVCWLWNLVFGCVIFLDALCCRNITKPRKVRENVKTEKVREVEVQREQDFVQPPVSVINGNIRSYFDISTHPEYLDYKKSMEAITRFNTSDKEMSMKEGSHRAWVYSPTEASWHPKSHSSREWDMINEGYVSDEGERNVDFNHNLKNFEQGQRKVEIVKPSQGKPVRIPVPPPLPPSGSCNC